MAKSDDRGGKTMYSVTVMSRGMIDLLTTILEYEAGLRGSSRGNALVEMMSSRVGRGGYPEELVARFRELDAARSRAALERCLGLAEIGPAA